MRAPQFCRRSRPMSKPIALTDNQMTAIMRAAEPLQPDDRGPFLERVAARLQAIEIGDGSVGRVCRELQRDSPAVGRSAHRQIWAPRPASALSRLIAPLIV